MSCFVIADLALVAAVNTLAHFCFKRSSLIKRRRDFVFWQAAGNLAGFAGVLGYTWLLGRMGLHRAFPLVQGFTALGVQLVLGLLVFKERIGARAWIGALLVVGGMVAIQV